MDAEWNELEAIRVEQIGLEAVRLAWVGLSQTDWNRLDWVGLVRLEWSADGAVPPAVPRPVSEVLQWRVIIDTVFIGLLRWFRAMSTYVSNTHGG